MNQSEHEANTLAGAKRGKTRANKSWLASVLRLIGWESGARIFDQWQSVAVQNPSNHESTFDTQLKAALLDEFWLDPNDN